MSKILGYILAIVGIAGLAITNIPEVKKLIPIPAQFSTSVSNTTLMIISAAIALVGILLIMKGGGRGKQVSEVPIYQGKNVVGFRRLGKR